MLTKLTALTLEAAEIIKKGGIVAFPTETVYGLGADIFNTSAVEKIFTAKRRPADNPLIAHISASDEIYLISDDIRDHAMKLIERFFPGPISVVVKRKANVPLIATAGLDSIGVRMPRLAVAHEFLQQCGGPVVAPSANLSGRPSPTTWQSVLEDLDGRIDCLLKGPDTEIGLESTVVDCTGEYPAVLRTGAVTIEQLRQVFPDIRISNTGSGEILPSPGLRHRHYAPNAKVVLIDKGQGNTTDDPASFIGLHPPDSEFALVKLCDSPEEYARSLFSFFRASDSAGVKTIYCERVPESGIGRALMDRIERAAKG